MPPWILRRPRHWSPLLLPALVALALAACSSGTPAKTAPPPRDAGADADADASDASTVERTLISMDFTSVGKADFYGSPFPTDARAGSADLADFPNPHQNIVAANVLALLKQEASAGFGLTSGVFFKVSAPIDAAGLPSFAASVKPGSAVFLIGVDPASPDYLQRYPVSTGFLADGGPYGAPNLLVVLPLQGVPLRPKTRYAAVVTKGVHDAAGEPLGVPAEMAALAAGKRPEGLGDAGFATYQAAIAALGKASVDASRRSRASPCSRPAPRGRLSARWSPR